MTIIHNSNRNIIKNQIDIPGMYEKIKKSPKTNKYFDYKRTETYWYVVSAISKIIYIGSIEKLDEIKHYFCGRMKEHVYKESVEERHFIFEFSKDFKLLELYPLYHEDEKEKNQIDEVIYTVFQEEIERYLDMLFQI